MIKIINKFIEFLEKRFKLSRKFITYALIGISGVCFDLAVFFILANLLHIGPFVSNFISSSAATCYTFTLNAFLNFKKTNKLFLRFISFYSVGLCGIAFSSFIFYIFINLLNFDKNIVKIGSLFGVLILQYFLNSRITFKGKN